MIDSAVYDYLQGLLPKGLQFVDPYIDTLPQPPTDWAQMNILDIENIAWSQPRRIDDEDKLIEAYDIERVYHIQFDFYGKSAYENALNYQQTLQVAVGSDDNPTLDFKSVGSIENRTFLQENKKYQYRYGFDISVFVIDTITSESPYFDKIKYKIVNRGNNF